MTLSKNRSFSRLASNINDQGDITSAGIATDVSLGATVYDSIGDLPYSGVNEGQTALIPSTGRFYVYSGQGWYNVAVINRTPSFTSITDSDGNTTPFVLSIEGETTTITITAADSDGDPITYSATADSDFNGLASITNDGNEFTITPFSQDSASTTSGTITFKATDGINIASSISTFTLAFVSEYWDETVLSIGTSSTDGLGNSTFIDRSTNAHTVTPFGSPVQTAFHPYLSKYSLYLDGSGDWLRDDTIGDEIQTAFVDSGVTIEFWALPQFSDNSPVVIGSNSSSAGNEFLVQADSIALYSNGSFSSHSYSSGMNRYEWNHYVIQFDLNDSRRISVWINGSRVLNMTRSGWFNIANNSFGFGAESDSGYWGGLGNYWNGYLFDMRMTTGPVYGNVDTIDVPTTVQPTLQDTFVHIFKSNNWSNEGRTWQDTGGTPTISSYTPFGQESEYAAGENKGSTYFDGSGDYLTSPSDTDFQFGTGDFTVQGWMYPTTSSSAVILFSHDGASNGTFYVYRATDKYIDSWVYGDDVVTNQTIIVPDFAWSHIAVSRTGGFIRVFVNGELCHSSSSTRDITKSTCNIGRQFNGNATGSTYLADVKIEKGTAVYTSAFTPPTAPVGNTNADLYLPMDNAGIFDKTGLNTLTSVGNVSTSTTQTKFADTAMYFDGSGDYLDLPSASEFDFGSGDFTIETWIYATSSLTTNNRTIIDARPASGGYSNNYLLFVSTSGKLTFGFADSTVGSEDFSTTSTLSPNNWIHVAVARSGDTIRVFVNGSAENTSNVSGKSFNSSLFRVGYRVYSTSSLTYWDGYLENFQILKGVAKYTANFTPPNRTQGRTYQAES